MRQPSNTLNGLTINKIASGKCMSCIIVVKVSFK